QDRVAGVAIEATAGWRWVARELRAHGFEVHLIDPGRASALQGRRRRSKTDRLDARWLALVVARELLSECEAWLPPEEIQRLRDQTRLRKALADDHTRWAQRLHAPLTHEGWPCARSRLLTATGRRWIDSLSLDASARGQSREATSAAARCRRSSASARSSLATCSPRSATSAASNAPASSCAPVVSTRPCSNPPTAS